MPKVSMGYVKKIKKNKKEENSHAKKSMREKMHAKEHGEIKRERKEKKK